MTPLETEANPNIRVGPLRWGRPLTQNMDHFFYKKNGGRTPGRIWKLDGSH